MAAVGVSEGKFVRHVVGELSLEIDKDVRRKLPNFGRILQKCSEVREGVLPEARRAAPITQTDCEVGWIDRRPRLGAGVQVRQQTENWAIDWDIKHEQGTSVRSEAQKFS
jgi:hypothetical protein